MMEQLIIIILIIITVKFIIYIDKPVKRKTILGDLTGRYKLIKKANGNKVEVEYRKANSKKTYFREATEVDIIILKKLKIIR